MKSYANFLLLENLLYALPTQSTLIRTLAGSLFNPRVKIVEEDCSPGIGATFPTSYVLNTSISTPIGDRVGMYNFLLQLDGTPVTDAFLASSLSEGSTNIMVRHSGACNSTGGICQVCALSNMLQSTANFVEEDASVWKYFYSTPAPTVDEVTLPEVGSSITLNSSIGRVKSFFQPSERAYFAWIASTYLGSMLGVNAFDTFPMPIKPSLARSILNGNILAGAVGELTRIRDIPSNYVDYLDSLDDALEKAVATVLLYSVYGGGALGGLPPVFTRAKDILRAPELPPEPDPGP